MAFANRPRTRARRTNGTRMPDGLWTKCVSCGEILYNKVLDEHLKTCPKCRYHFSLTAPERIQTLVDPGTFQELAADLAPTDPLEFQGPIAYREKLRQEQAAYGLLDACLVGTGALGGHRLALGVTDSRFLMGSMGSVVGEKLTRLIETATEHQLPLVIVSGSGGGARMQEGMLSLMQMAKTSAALARFDRAGGLFISVLTNPTMAGIMASFASLGDVMVAEPRALIGFTGPRVIEQTIRQKLPPGFQTSEFLLEHGLVDVVVHRKNLKETIATLLEYASSPWHKSA